MSRFFGWWDKESQTFVYSKPEAPRKEESAAILTDEIEPTESMATADREIFTSRRKLFDHYKAHGYECTGGDHLGRKPPELKRSTPRELKDMAEKAYMDIKYDRIPIDERSKERCKTEERAFQEYQRRVCR